MLGRRKGTPALDEHVSDPTNSSIFTSTHLFLMISLWSSFYVILQILSWTVDKNLGRLEAYEFGASCLKLRLVAP